MLICLVLCVVLLQIFGSVQLLFLSNSEEDLIHLDCHDINRLIFHMLPLLFVRLHHLISIVNFVFLVTLILIYFKEKSYKNNFFKSSSKYLWVFWWILDISCQPLYGQLKYQPFHGSNVPLG